MDFETKNRIMHNIQLYYTPILVHLGLLGNCLSIFVFFGTKLRYSSSSIYLGALAISDIGFLITIFVVWFDMVNVHIFSEPGFCQFFTFFGHVCSFLSVWLVVSFTVERYIAVKYPLRRQSLCTVSRAKMVVIGLTALAIMLCIPVLLFVDSHAAQTLYGNKTICDLNKDWMSWATVYNSVDTVLTFAVPLTTLIIFNTLIARNIYKFNRVRRTLTLESDISNERGKDIHNPRDRMQQTKVTKMLLIVSSAFLCLNMPAFMLRMIIFIYINPPLEIIWAHEISNLLFDTSFGINFILYCSSGSNFRKAMIHIFMNRSSTRRNRTLIQMKNHGKECVSECTHKWSSKKQHSINTVQSKISQETQKFPVNEL